MALFEREAEHEEEAVSGRDAATRALSVTAVENDFVEGVYDKLAKVYDLFFGPTLHPGDLAYGLRDHASIERRQSLHVQHVAHVLTPIELCDLVIEPYPLQDLEDLDQGVGLVVGQ